MSVVPDSPIRRRGAAGVIAVAALSMSVTGGAHPAAAQQQPEPPRLIVQLGHGSSDVEVAFSPDGKFVLTGSGDTAKLWVAENGRQIRDFIGHKQEVVDVAFSPDGRHVLTGSQDDTAVLWDVRTGQPIRTFRGHTDSVVSVAFSPDGGRVVTGSDDKTARVWDTHTGRELRRLAGHSDEVKAAAFSPDGTSVLTGSSDHTARLWDAASGRRLRTFAGHERPLYTVAFSPLGTQVATGSADGAAKIWDLATAKELRSLEHGREVQSIAFSGDGHRLVSASNNRTATLWDLSSGQEIRTFTGHTFWVESVAFSPDGRWILTGGGDRTARLWDAETGRELRSFAGYSDSVESLMFSHDGRRILTGSFHNSAALWDAGTGRQLRRFAGPAAQGLFSADVSPDDRLMLTANGDERITLWDLETGQELRTFVAEPRFRDEIDGMSQVAFSPDGKSFVSVGRRSGTVLWETDTGRPIRTFGDAGGGAAMTAAMSPDGQFLLTGSSDILGGHAKAKLWDVQTGKLVRSFDTRSLFAMGVAFSPDSRRILTGGELAPKLWDRDSGRLLRSFEGHAYAVSRSVFSPDGRRLLTASDDHTARLWDVETGKTLQVLEGHRASVSSVAFSPDGRWALTGSIDQTTRVWHAESGQLLCTLVTFNNGSWAVVAPDGRFDTDNLDGNPGLHWVVPDDPLQPLPLEIFMRDNYEPGLLRRLLAGERLAPVRALTELNRVQPIVKLVTVATSAGDPGLVDVTVEVKRAEREFLRQGKTVSIATEVYDLRLFRDGQIVGQWPRPTADPNSAAAGGAASLESWRRSNTVSLDAATGAATMTFKSIRLPRREGTQTIEFTAYAFNEDRVKSETARLPYDVPADLTARKGRAYVVTFGVNLSQNPAFDLRYAAPDALALSQALLPRVSGTGVFEEVVDVPLVSDYEIKDGVKVPVQVSATKANLKAVLDRLAGRESDAEAASRVRGIDRIRPARPEDMLILSFSSHGVADGSGGFFFLPYDVGPGRTSEITQDVLARAISSDELSAWLREVDAGQIAIIADACHSAATVDAQGFKPGPMGSRGLGQLAYDKRIMLLAASQAADVAFEYDALQHGLLTYALVQDGLSNGAADHRPRDGEVRLNEWLSFGADRVPKLDQAIREKRFDALGLDPARTRGLLIAPGAPGFQSPVLFDFSGNRPSATIAR